MNKIKIVIIKKMQSNFKIAILKMYCNLKNITEIQQIYPIE